MRLIDFHQSSVLDIVAARCLFGDTHVTYGFEATFAEVLGKHILGLLTLTMASVADNGNSHVTLLIVIGKDAFEAIRQSGKICVSSEALLEHSRLDGNLLSLVLQVRAVQISLILARGKRCLGRVNVHALVHVLRR